MVFVLLNFVHEDSHLSVFNSVYKMISHLQGNFFGAIFFDHDGVFPCWMKFYFILLNFQRLPLGGCEEDQGRIKNSRSGMSSMF